MKKYIVILLITLLFTPRIAFSQEPGSVCFTEKEAVDIITLLDASERDLELLSSCQKLVKDLYLQLDDRDNKIATLTEELISAKQKTIEYKLAAARWKRVAWYTGIGGAIIVVLEILPKVL